VPALHEHGSRDVREDEIEGSRHQRGRAVARHDRSSTRQAGMMAGAATASGRGPRGGGPRAERARQRRGCRLPVPVEHSGPGTALRQVPKQSEAQRVDSCVPVPKARRDRTTRTSGLSSASLRAPRGLTMSRGVEGPEAFAKRATQSTSAPPPLQRARGSGTSAAAGRSRPGPSGKYASAPRHECRREGPRSPPVPCSHSSAVPRLPRPPGTVTRRPDRTQARMSFTLPKNERPSPRGSAREHLRELLSSVAARR